jgi:hypothetical protein
MELYKHSNHRNTKYLAWLRNQRCLVTNKPAEVAHHIRLGTNGGKALKPSDYFCVPLTEEFHTHGQGAVHRIGEETFLNTHKISLNKVIIKFLGQYVETMLNKSFINKNLEDLDQIDLLIEKAETFNKTGTKKVAKKVKAKKVNITPKVSVTENEFYQKAKELKRIRDKELRDKIKVEKSEARKNTKFKMPVKKVAKQTAKKAAIDSDYYQDAKELQKKIAKEKREESRVAQSEYRKKMYQKAKAEQKKYLASKKGKS